MQSSEYKKVSTGVRPPRSIVLLDRTDPDWTSTVHRVIELFSRTWGGHDYLIIPTDGQSIDARFWHLAAEYDPDYLFWYRKTGTDILVMGSMMFEELVSSEIDGHLEQDRKLDREWLTKEVRRHLLTAPASSFHISAELAQQLIARLSPFYWSEAGAVHAIAISQQLPHVLCSLTEVLPLAAMPPESLHHIEVTGHPLLALYAYSVFGRADSRLNDAVTNLGREVEFHTYSDAETADLLDLLFEHKSNTIRKRMRLVVEDRKDEPRSPEIFPFVPFQWAALGLASYRPLAYNEYQLPPVVVAGDSLDDFCLYYCLSRLRGDVFWAPTSLMSVDIDDNPADPLALFGLTIGSQLSSRLTEKERDTVYTISISQIDSDPSQLFENCSSPRTHRCTPVKCTSISDLLPSRLVVYEKNNQPGPAKAYHLIDGATAGGLETPKPRSFTSIDPLKHKWVTDVLVDGYRIPRRSFLGPLHLGTKLATDSARVCREGLSYPCPFHGFYSGEDVDQVLVRPTLRLLTAHELFNSLFAHENAQIAPSDKGSFMEYSLRMMGSLKDWVSLLRNPAQKAVLDLFVDTTPPRRDAFGEGVLLDKKTPRLLDFRAVSAAMTDAHAAREFLDGLVRKSVINRGFVFQCEKCRQVDWYSVADVGVQFRCSRCGTHQFYTVRHWREPQEEPSWFYRLDEVVYQGYKHHMWVPLLTLGYLEQLGKTFMFVPESQFAVGREIDPANDPEIDVLACVDSDIFVGECKVNDSLGKSPNEERAEIRKYVYAAQLLRARSVVFSTYAETWNAATLGRIRSEMETSGLEYRLLNRGDLLSGPSSQGH